MRPRILCVVRLVLVVFAAASIASGAAAQEKETSPAEAAPATPAASQAEPAGVPVLRGASVTLPWTEVRGLLEKVHEASRREEERSREAEPPSDALYLGASYSASVGRSSTAFEARLRIDLLTDGWHRIPLLGAGPSIVSATLDGEPARLVLEEERYHLVARGRGRRTLVMRFVLPRGTEAGDSNLDLRVPGFPRNRLELVIPRPGITVGIEPAGSVRHTESGGTTRVVADIPWTEQLRITWAGALPASEVQAARIQRRCAVSQLVSVGGGLIRLDARLTFSILQGKIERFDLRLPPDTTLLDVSGDVVREHRVIRNAGGSAVAVSLSRPVTGTFAVRVQAERTLDGGESALVPELSILDVEREWGHVGVTATTNIEVDPTGTKGLTRIDVKELPAEVWQVAQHPVLLSYKYFGHPYELRLAVRRHDDLPVLESTIDSAFVTTFATGDGKLLHSALLQTKNTHKQFLKARLPAGSRVLAAFVSDLPVRPATNEGGEVLVPLEKSVAGDTDQKPFPVEIVYLEEGRSLAGFGRSEHRALSVDIPVSVFRWTLYLPRAFTYWGFSGSLDRGPGWDTTPRGSDPVARQAIERLESQGLRAASGAGGEVGLLPVRINLPAAGQRFSFQSELVMAGEKPPTVSYRYVGAGFTRALRGLLSLAAILVVVRAALVLAAARRGEDVASRLRGVTFLVVGLSGLVALETWALGASVPIVAATLVAAIVCADTHLGGRPDPPVSPASPEPEVPAEPS